MGETGSGAEIVSEEKYSRERKRTKRPPLALIWKQPQWLTRPLSAELAGAFPIVCYLGKSPPMEKGSLLCSLSSR